MSRHLLKRHGLVRGDVEAIKGDLKLAKGDVDTVKGEINVVKGNVERLEERLDARFTQARCQAWKPSSRKWSLMWIPDSISWRLT